MSRETERKTNKFASSFGAGLGAVTGGGDYYILEITSSTSAFPAGHQEEVIVNYIELGRHPKCGIRFGAKESTVSRRHAAIQKEGNQYVLIQLSKTNPTLLNGRPVNKKWYLQNGDSIQLSLEGPKLNFLIPKANKKNNSIGLSRRLSLFRRQAMRPYRRMISALAVVLALVIGVGGYITYDNYAQKKAFRNKLSTLTSLLDSAEQKQASLVDSLRDSQNVSQATIVQMDRKIRQMQGQIADARDANQSGTVAMEQSQRFSELHPDICFVIATNVMLTDPNGQSQLLEGYSWTGTGFLTRDGKFVTARHVVEPWYYPSDPESLILNASIQNGGQLEATIHAFSPDSRDFSFSTNDFTLDRSADSFDTIEVEGREPLVVQQALEACGKDWAWVGVPQGEGDLIPAYDLSTQIPQASPLFIFGYPLSVGVQRQGNQIASLTPLFAKTDAALDGLNDGCLLSTTVSFTFGNSGGPVFIEDSGKYKVVGIVSGGKGEAIGRFAPISETE